MPVEIHFLSGARQEERLYIDAGEFRAGDRRECEVFFDPSQDQAAEGRSALFCLREDGWHVENTGAGNLLINNQRLVGSARIRSGDVVRMSDRGPDFCFRLVAQPVTGSVLPAQPPAAHEPADLAAGDSLGSAGRAPIRWESSAEAERTAATAAPNLPRAPLGILAAAVIVLVGVVLVWWAMSGPKPADPGRIAPPVVPVAERFSPKEPKDLTEASTKPSSPDSQPKAVASASDERPNPEARPATDERAKASSTPPVSGPPAEPKAETAAEAQRSPMETKDSVFNGWNAVGERAGKAVLMLCVEDTKSKSTWVLATGAAISETLVLTSATVATDLARFRQDASRWKIWACRETGGEQFPIQDIRVHVGYVRSAQTPQRKVFFDVALIATDRPLPKRLALASAEVLAELGAGYPLACIGVSPEEEPINRFQSLAPELVPAKVLLLTPLEPSPKAPRLLHIKAARPERRIPPGFHGSPLITAEGSLAAVYSTPAGAAGNESQELRMHYAVVVEPELIAAWEQGRRDEIWVAPEPAALQPPASQPTP